MSNITDYFIKSGQEYMFFLYIEALLFLIYILVTVIHQGYDVLNADLPFPVETESITG